MNFENNNADINNNYENQNINDKKNNSHLSNIINNNNNNNVGDSEYNFPKDNTEEAKKSKNSQKSLNLPRLVIESALTVNPLEDGYHWRKYGQKTVNYPLNVLIYQ